MQTNFIKRILMLFSIVFITISLNAQSKDELAIRAVMNKQLGSWNNGNIDAFMETYWKSDSLIFVGAKGPTYGWQNTIDHYKQAFPDTTAMGKLDFKIISVKQLDKEYAFVLGQWHLRRTIGDMGGSFTLLFKKMNGQWFIVVDHSS